MIIKNFSQLSTSKEKKDALTIVEAGIERVLPSRVISESLRLEGEMLVVGGDTYPLKNRRLFVVGGGKASGAMAEALEKLITPERITAGVINSKGADYHTRKIKINRAGHPLPDEKGLRGVREMLEIKEKYDLDADDLVFCLISGGGSALLAYPRDGITLIDKQKTSELLLKCGAGIREVNIVRKHISKIKGGGLSFFFHPAKIISLIISDVLGDDLSAIASGPTYFDASTFTDAYEVLARYVLLAKVPVGVKDYIERGIRGEVEETLKKKLENARNYIVGSNKIAIEAMAKRAEELGYKAIILTDRLEGEAVIAAKETAQKVMGLDLTQPKAVILGGETTVTVGEKEGRGGRNQEYVSAGLEVLNRLECPWALASVASDGSDFLNDVAGGIIDHKSAARALGLNLSPVQFLENHDSYNFLAPLDSLVLTGGETGTNVCDLVVYILNPKEK